MTFKDKAIDLMYQCGMFKEDAEKVFQKIQCDPANEAMLDRWNEDVSGYPRQSINILWLTVKRNASEWIAENQPQAWYRPMFDDLEK